VGLGGALGCAEQATQGSESDDDLAATATQAVEVEGVTEHFDPALAAIIAKAKLASIEANAPSPQAAACGRAGPTGTSERVNDAAFTGAANQRNGTVAVSSNNCTIVGVLQPTDDALYFCWTLGNDGFTWTYAQNLRTGVRGWTRDNLLRPPPGAGVGGARNNCGI